MTPIFTRARDGGWPFDLGVAGPEQAWGEPSEAGAFRLAWVAQGGTIGLVNGVRTWLEAPGFVALGPRDRLEPTADDRPAGLVVAFRPLILNQAFADHDVYDEAAFDDTANQDRYYLEPFLGPGRRTSRFVPLTDLAHRRIADLVGRVATELTDQADRYWPCRARSHLIELLFLVRQVWDSPDEALPRTGVVDQEMDRVALYLHVHCGEPLTIPGLAAEFATNRTTLMARFKAHFGLTIAAYLAEVRIRRAAMMLRESTLPPAEVGARNGYASPSHFSRAFRQAVGQTPTAYRATTSPSP